MKLRELLEQAGRNDSYTFIIQKAVPDEGAPGYTNTYRTTPIRTVWEWLSSPVPDKYIVIKRDHPPIDATGGGWLNRYNGGHLGCCMITTEQDLLTHYGEKQGREMIEWYDKGVRKDVKN